MIEAAHGLDVKVDSDQKGEGMSAGTVHRRVADWTVASADAKDSPVKLLAEDQDDGSVWFEWADAEVVARLERAVDGTWWLRRPGRADVFIQRPGVLQPANRTQAHGMVSIDIADSLAARRRGGRYRRRGG